MLPTPAYHITEEQRISVYDPSEDTFLLLDAIQSDLPALLEADPAVVVDVGCGTGVVSAFCQKLLNKPVCIIATDLNYSALQCTRHTAFLNSISIATVQCDLVSAIRSRLGGRIDVLIFNPPYVPTSEAEARQSNASSWAGGTNGRATLDRLMQQVPELLSPNGCFYVIALSANNIPHLLESNPRLCGRILLERQCGSEYLYALKFVLCSS